MSKITIKPTTGNVFIRLLPESENKSGIIIPDSKKTWEKDTVLAEIVNKHPKFNEVEVGDIVVIRGDAGRWVDPELVEDRDFVYRIISDSEIIGIVQQAPTSAETLGVTPPLEMTTEPSENGVYMAMIRRSPHSMYLDIPKWFASLGMTKVLSHAQSESDGNITITVFYRKD